jgi:hypothetical protein
MAIITTAQVKTYLQIDSTTYDDIIDALIEPVLYDVFDYTQNYFHNNAVRLRSNQFTFSTLGTVVVAGTNFSTYSFQSGDIIHVVDSARNDGIYTATTVSSATITISTAETLLAETEEKRTTIAKMDVPRSLFPTISAMIKSRIDNPSGTPISQSLGDYSVVYGGKDYPESIEKSLGKYRLVGFV